VLLAVQSATALALAALGRGASEGALLAAVAGQLPGALPMRAVVTWVALQTAALAAILLPGHSLRGALTATLGFGAFQLFAAGAALLAESEARARREMAAAHAELLGTRELLTQATRAAERLRLARELHDALGHHLAALSLNLEAAVHLARGEAAEPVARAQAVARLLLAEVRDVVQSTRDEPPADLGAALQALAAGVREPRVHLALPEGPLAPEDEAAAHALFRCVQEVVTNAVRHSNARNLWITVHADSEGLRVEARDDGRGAGPIAAGLGLTGMRERLARSGGRLEIASQPGRGFSLVAWLPAAGPR
jgi:signal transduction histidine kinase